MANNEQPQSSQDSLPRRSYTANAQQPLGGVRQDKGVLTNARIASRQPAPHKEDMRAHETNSNNPRSQNRPAPKRKTVHLTLWVKPVVKAELKRIAESEGLSASSTGAAFLEEAIRQKLHVQHAVLLQPIIEQAIRRQMRTISTRLAYLLVRVAYDGGQTRQLVTNILSRQPGMTPGVLNQILDSSNNAAKRNVLRRTPQIASLIAEVEKWLSEEENLAS